MDGSRSRWRRAAAIVILLPLLAVAAPEETAEEAIPPMPRTRRVVLTSATCDMDVAEPMTHRKCVMRSLIDGEQLLVYDLQAETLFQPVFDTEQVQFRAVNDFGGLEAFIRGTWDEENQFVVVLDIHPSVPRPALDMLVVDNP